MVGFRVIDLAGLRGGGTKMGVARELSTWLVLDRASRRVRVRARVGEAPTSHRPPNLAPIGPAD